MLFSPLSTFCADVSGICTSAFLLTRPFDPSCGFDTRDDLYLAASLRITQLFEDGAIDFGFADYLDQHLDFAFANGEL